MDTKEISDPKAVSDDKASSELERKEKRKEYLRKYRAEHAAERKAYHDEYNKKYFKTNQEKIMGFRQKSEAYKNYQNEYQGELFECCCKKHILRKSLYYHRRICEAFKAQEKVPKNKINCDFICLFIR